jgi:hypothetical protein
MCLLRCRYCVFILSMEADICMLRYVFVEIWVVCVYATNGCA